MSRTQKTVIVLAAFVALVLGLTVNKVLNSKGDGTDKVAMLDQSWRIETVRTATDDPEIARVVVRVYPLEGKAPLASLDGFLDVPKAARS